MVTDEDCTGIDMAAFEWVKETIVVYEVSHNGAFNDFAAQVTTNSRGLLRGQREPTFNDVEKTPNVREGVRETKLTIGESL
jgi:hypothetical protein